MFVIPVGHEEGTVRRLPLVTFAIIAVNLLAFLTIGLQAERAQSRASKQLEELVTYWQEHPYLEIPTDVLQASAGPGERERVSLITEAAKGAGVEGEEAERRAREQRRLDGLASAFREAHTGHPYRTLGFVPAAPRVSALVTSMFLHAGWLHLLSNMFILFLVGPAVEDRLGRPIYGSAYLASGVVAALAHMAAFPTSTAPLVGASGAIAGVMGIFLVRLARTRMRFAYFVFLGLRALRGTFSAPAWLMLSLWLLQQVFLGTLAREGAGVAYWAHAGGFTFGVLVAVVLRAARIEERFVHPAIEAQISITLHPGLDAGLEHLREGQAELAWQAFTTVVAEDPQCTDGYLGLWQTAVAIGEPARGFGAMQSVVDLELRHQEVALAVDHWREGTSVTGREVAASLRYRLALAAVDSHRDVAIELLRGLVKDADAGMLTEKAARRLAELGEGAEPPPPPEPEPESRPTHPDASTAVPVRAEVCIPERIQGEGLLLRGSDGAVELLPFAEISALAVVGVTAAPRPVLLVDALVRSESGLADRVVRLTSASFDPRAVAGLPGAAPMEAMRRIVSAMASDGRTSFRRGGEFLSGGRPPMYPSVEAVDLEVWGDVLAVEDGTLEGELAPVGS